MNAIQRIQSILNIIPQTSLQIIQQDSTAAIVGIGSTGTEIADNSLGNQRLRKVAEGIVFCSKIEAARLKNIRKNRRHIVSNQGLGKDQVEGLRAWAEQLLQSVDQVKEIIDKYGINCLLFINSLAGGTGIGSNLLIPTLKNQRYIKRAVLFSIVPADTEDRDLLRNTLNGLIQTLNLLDSEEIDFLLTAQSDKIVPNDSANFKRTDLNIARVLEMLVASCRNGDANVDISDLFGKYLHDKESPMDRIGTLGYESKPITRHNKDFASEVIKELTTRVIENNWMRSDISKKCQKVLFVIRTDEKYLTDNNKQLIIQTARQMVPKNCDIHVNVYSVPRLQKIEIAALFKGIRTDIMSRFQKIIEESESDTEESAEPASVTAWQAMGFDSNPFPAQEVEA